MKNKLPTANVFELLYEPADATALQALSAGTADPDQQKRALDWILTHASRLREPSFRPDSSDQTAFCEGRRFVGLSIAKLLSVNPRALVRTNG